MVKKENKHTDKHCCCGEKSPFVAVPASLGGILFVIILVVLIFAPSSMQHTPSIVWGFVVLGVVAMFFAHLATKNKK